MLSGSFLFIVAGLLSWNAELSAFFSQTQKMSIFDAIQVFVCSDLGVEPLASESYHRHSLPSTWAGLCLESYRYGSCEKETPHADLKVPLQRSAQDLFKRIWLLPALGYPLHWRRLARQHLVALLSEVSNGHAVSHRLLSKTSHFPKILR